MLQYALGADLSVSFPSLVAITNASEPVCGFNPSACDLVGEVFCALGEPCLARLNGTSMRSFNGLAVVRKEKTERVLSTCCLQEIWRLRKRGLTPDWFAGAAEWRAICFEHRHGVGCQDTHRDRERERERESESARQRERYWQPAKDDTCSFALECLGTIRATELKC